MPTAEGLREWMAARKAEIEAGTLVPPPGETLYDLFYREWKVQSTMREVQRHRIYYSIEREHKRQLRARGRWRFAS